VLIGRNILIVNFWLKLINLVCNERDIFLLGLKISKNILTFTLYMESSLLFNQSL